MVKNRKLDDYKMAGAWMRICKAVIANTWTKCWSVLSAKDCRMFDAAERRISALCSRAEDNMFMDFPDLDNEALDIFYGSPDTDPRTDTDREQIKIMQEFVMKIFGENWTAGQGGDEA